MLILTRPAIAAIKASMTANDKIDHGVRIMAEAGGCSGPAYAMRFEAEPGAGDTIVEIRDVRVYVDEASMKILAGATVDYSENPDDFGFNFSLAPQEEGEPSQIASCASKGSGGCSCGKPS